MKTSCPEQRVVIKTPSRVFSRDKLNVSKTNVYVVLTNTNQLHNIYEKLSLRESKQTRVLCHELKRQRFRFLVPRFISVVPPLPTFRNRALYPLCVDHRGKGLIVCKLLESFFTIVARACTRVTRARVSISRVRTLASASMRSVIEE